MLMVQGLRKLFHTAEGNHAAVDTVSFEVEKGQFYTLLGPSGCGKTTTLRCLAGLEQPDSGEITIGDTLVFSSTRGVRVPANRRAIGMVFQSYAIWPHLSVFGNVAYPLRIKRVPKAEILRRVEAVLGLVGLTDLVDRPASLLSGGQQQRVALARALIAEPELLLLDEPLSNLDATLRHQMRSELKKMQNQLGVTTVYVTHDQQEAMSMSDRVAIMDRGKIVQSGPPDEIYRHPATEFVATFVGSTNLVRGELPTADLKRGVNHVSTELGVIKAYAAGARRLPSNRVSLSIRPELASLRDEASPDEGVNSLAGRVIHAAYLGDSIEYEVSVQGTHLRVKAPDLGRRPLGSEVTVCFPVEHCILVGEGQGEPVIEPDDSAADGRCAMEPRKLGAKD